MTDITSEMKAGLLSVLVFGVAIIIAAALTKVYYMYIVGGIGIGFVYGMVRALEVVKCAQRQVELELADELERMADELERFRAFRERANRGAGA